jgi:hypothetical protein
MDDDLELTPMPKKKSKKTKAEIELDKMLAEARAAEAELAKKEASKPVEVQPQQSLPEVKKEPIQSKPESDSLKWFFIGLIVISVIGGYFLYNNLHHGITPITLTTGLAVYDPHSWLKDWQVISYGVNLAEIEPAIRTEMISQGVTDAAVWEYGKDDDRLYFWIRVYQDNETRSKYNYVFNGPLVWRDGFRDRIAAGDEGIVGIYRVEGNDPLMVYIAKDNQIWYVSYFNYANENGSAYNATNMDADKQFLVDIGKEFYNSFNSS